MKAEDAVADITKQQFVASVQQRLFEFTMGEALAESAPGLSSNFETQRIREAFINQSTLRQNKKEIKRTNEILQQSQPPSRGSKPPKSKVSQDVKRKESNNDQRSKNSNSAKVQAHDDFESLKEEIEDGSDDESLDDRSKGPAIVPHPQIKAYSEKCSYTVCVLPTLAPIKKHHM